MTDMNQAESIGAKSSAKLTDYDRIESAGDDSLTDRVLTIQTLLSDNGAEVEFSEIEAKMNELIRVFKVPPTEAQRSATTSFLKKYNISKSKVFTGKGSAVTKRIGDINAMTGTPDTWVNVTARVIQLWENHHESIAQVGLIGDETGIIKFTLWNNAGIDLLELNKTYDFKNVVVKSWNDKVSIDLNRAASVELSEREIVMQRGDGKEPSERTNEMRTVSELNRDGLWTDLKASVVQLFENTHESIAFAGILGDETGTVRFTAWKTSGIENMEAGKSYRFTSAIVKEWNGNFALELNRTCKIEEIDEEIKARPAVYEVRGCAVDIQAGSGLIRRCPECSKVLSKGICTDHGKMKGKYDLRIKAVFDDGNCAHEAIVNCALTEEILGIRLEDAVLMATETLDPDCVNDLIKKEFLGKYYVVRGFRTDRFIIAESVKTAEPVVSEDVNALRERIKAELENKPEAFKAAENAGAEKKTDLDEFEKMPESTDDSEYIDDAEVI